jgi:hypothetical protein
VLCAFLAVVAVVVIRRRVGSFQVAKSVILDWDGDSMSAGSFDRINFSEAIQNHDWADFDEI